MRTWARRCSRMLWILLRRRWRSTTLRRWGASCRVPGRQEGTVVGTRWAPACGVPLALVWIAEEGRKDGRESFAIHCELQLNPFSRPAFLITQDVAAYIKKELDKKHSPTWWIRLLLRCFDCCIEFNLIFSAFSLSLLLSFLVRHVIVGRNFGSYVTHETKHFIYF